MDEFLLINMLCDINPELIDDNYIETDLKKKGEPFWKRVFTFLKSKDESKDFIEPFAITNIDEEYHEQLDTIIVEAASDDEYTVQEEDLTQRNFPIVIFKKKVTNIFTVISGVAATIFFIVGIVIFLIRKTKNMKENGEKIQISF